MVEKDLRISLNEKGEIVLNQVSIFSQSKFVEVQDLLKNGLLVLKGRIKATRDQIKNLQYEVDRLEIDLADKEQRQKMYQDFLVEKGIVIENPEEVNDEQTGAEQILQENGAETQ
jgi:hypothetical protein